VSEAVASHIAAWSERIENTLASAVRRDDGVRELWDAMGYSLLAGGKRLRPLLALASCHAASGDAERALGPAASLEMIHAYSLIHDDLPAMDDDDLRRGQPTNHVVHGEAMAILAGDALHTLAFETLARAPLPADARAELVGLLARAAGAAGMAGGQALDILHEGGTFDEALVDRIHTMKTGALLVASFEMGAVAAGATDEARDELVAIGRATGLAFQIRDDILDETASTEALGKTAGKDRATGKATWPAVVGLEEAERRCANLLDEAARRLQRFGERGEALASLVRRAVQRSR
jgi:geranylgeranyl pyrophosphate synthase